MSLPPSLFALPDSPSASTSLHHAFQCSSAIDPFVCVASDLLDLGSSLSALIQSDLPPLDELAQYFFHIPGKRVRPAIVLLMARALRRGRRSADELEQQPWEGRSWEAADSGLRDELDELAGRQRRLCEVCEVIHTCSLLHDDVLDESDMRRGVPSVNGRFGNARAVLAGDFLLSRAVVALARLRNHQVTELMLETSKHLVEGEVLQLHASQLIRDNLLGHTEQPFIVEQHISLYMRKTYSKTAALIAHSCKAVALLSDSSGAQHDSADDELERLAAIAFEYGRWLGLCFQVVDDVLDCVGDVRVMGKEGGWDLSHGVVTAPVLYAMDADAELRRLIAAGRASSTANQQDRAEVRQRILESGGVERARQLAEQCAESAVAAALQLKPSVARSALIALVKYVLERNK